MIPLRPDAAPPGHELLDDPRADPDLVLASLANIARSNSLFGGRAAACFGLARLASALPAGTRLTLLDLGTGAGDIPRAMERWAARHGITLMPIGLDRSRVAARMARDAGVPSIVGCLGALPVASRSVDFVVMSQVAHHLTARAVVALLRDASRVARLGVVLSDLRRSRAAAMAFGAAAAVLRFDAATRHDGVVSVRRGYHPAELRRLLDEAGIQAQLFSRPAARLVAVWRTT